MQKDKDSIRKRKEIKEDLKYLKKRTSRQNKSYKKVKDLFAKELKERREVVTLRLQKHYFLMKQALESSKI